MDDDGLQAFGDFEIDTSAADARAARIAAARAQAKDYSAKIEEPGWYNDPKEAARLKDPARATLFSIHQLYFEKEWDKVVEKGLELYAAAKKDESEIADLVMRAWQKATCTTQEKQDKIVAIAKRWPESSTQPSICHVSAQILDSAGSSEPACSSGLDTRLSSDLQSEALRSSLASLRLNRSQAPFVRTLRQIISRSQPLLTSALDDWDVAKAQREAILLELDKLDLTDVERDTLEHILGLHEEEAEGEEDVGRDVRSL